MTLEGICCAYLYGLIFRYFLLSSLYSRTYCFKVDTFSLFLLQEWRLNAIVQKERTKSNQSTFLWIHSGKVLLICTVTSHVAMALVAEPFKSLIPQSFTSSFFSSVFLFRFSIFSLPSDSSQFFYLFKDSF